MHLKTGTWRPTLDLSIGQRALATTKLAGVPSVPKQKAQRGKGKEAAPSKSKGKEKAPSQAKSKRKTVESSTVGAPKKKLLASATIRVAERAQI